MFRFETILDSGQPSQSIAMPLLSQLFLLFLVIIPQVLADAATDASRLGSFYTALDLYRGSATNILVVGIGTPPQDVNLTVSTNVDFIMVAADSCNGCTNGAAEFLTDDSSSLTATQQALSYTTTYPAGSLDTLHLTANFASEILTDARQDVNNERTITLISSVQDNFGAATGSSDIALPSGTSGFWGLGVYQVNKGYSIIPSVLAVTGEGAPSSATNYTVGFDIANYSSVDGSQAGTIHWGGAPTGSYEGNFNWINPNTTVAGSWGIPVNTIRVGHAVVDTSTLYGSLDPGFDAIYLPTTFAETLFAAVPGASRDLNLPCDANISMEITISGYQYNVANAQLIQPRDQAGQTCWGAVVAWQNGSVTETLGEIRLGTPFMSDIYSVLFYSPSEQLVGIAGKPNSVNALNVNSAGGPGHANKALARICEFLVTLQRLPLISPRQ
ncbi:MAG: hypothetical protein TREMPRED_005380 [Tremellales sp. Tagirdzhanova-0007]|nr:MAG: hypothetical protein TREMPRED_005380 [Tremellales sp. Tagirdzhanova-0007]